MSDTKILNKEGEVVKKDLKVLSSSFAKTQDMIRHVNDVESSKSEIEALLNENNELANEIARNNSTIEELSCEIEDSMSTIECLREELADTLKGLAKEFHERAEKLDKSILPLNK